MTNIDGIGIDPEPRNAIDGVLGLGVTAEVIEDLQG